MINLFYTNTFTLKSKSNFVFTPFFLKSCSSLPLVKKNIFILPFTKFHVGSNSSGDTIFAPSTAFSKAAVSVIRISGPKSKEILERMCTNPPKIPRKFNLTKIHHPLHTTLLDKALVVYFSAPNSYTGEDCLEFHLHGSLAVQKATLGALAYIPQCRMAERGEFTQRAFLNSKIGLLEAESIKDLINAETEQQRIQAMLQFQGSTEKVYEKWLDSLMKAMAHVEAGIDFGEEEQLDTALNQKVESFVSEVLQEIQTHLSDARRGDVLKHGIHATIFGIPNVGKSTLLNYLSKKHAALVTEFPGTTRDVIETHLDLGGYLVKLGDTAGLRESQDPIEQEGIKLTKQRLLQSHVKIAVFAATSKKDFLNQWALLSPYMDERTITVLNKLDLFPSTSSIKTKLMSSSSSFLASSLFPDLAPEHCIDVCISLTENIGLHELQQRLVQLFQTYYPPSLSPLHERHVHLLQQTVLHLQQFLSLSSKDIVVATEYLKLSQGQVAKLTGKQVVDIENVLDIVFRDFCIGK